MAFGYQQWRRWLPATLACLFLAGVLCTSAARGAKPGILHRSSDSDSTSSSATTTDPAAPADSAPASRPAYQVAERSEAAQAAALAPQLGPGQPNEHPLMPALRWAYSGVGNIEKLQDYSARLVKRERISGKLMEYEQMFVKVRHNPFSVYMYFLAPADLKGQEVIYIQGQNNGNMLAHGVGLKKIAGTIPLKPDGALAMQNERYPLTELGILNLTKRLVDVAEQDVKYGECEVKFYKGAKINNRVCTCIEVVHPVPRRNFLFHMAQIFVDDELNLPIRYASYDWPNPLTAPTGVEQLGEEYTYLDLKLNNGFTDADFDTRNPNYKFPR